MANTERYVALLRGINVGGKNIIGKDELRRAFEELGMADVRTYIQSGNVLFRSGHADVSRLTKHLERGLSERFGYEARAVAFSYPAYLAIVDAAPRSWGRDEERKHHAMFLLDGSAEDALAELPPAKRGLETRTPGPGVIFWSASKQSLGKTTLMKLAAMPVYQRMTLRNHNTVLKVLDLLEAL